MKKCLTQHEHVQMTIFTRNIIINLLVLFEELELKSAQSDIKLHSVPKQKATRSLRLFWTKISNFMLKKSPVSSSKTGCCLLSTSHVVRLQHTHTSVDTYIFVGTLYWLKKDSFLSHFKLCSKNLKVHAHSIESVRLCRGVPAHPVLYAPHVSLIQSGFPYGCHLQEADGEKKKRHHLGTNFEMFCHL